MRKFFALVLAVVAVVVLIGCVLASSERTLLIPSICLAFVFGVTITEMGN